MTEFEKILALPSVKAFTFLCLNTKQLSLDFDEIITANEAACKEFIGGKDKAIGSLIGQIMKKIKGDPRQVREQLVQKIKAKYS